MECVDGVLLGRWCTFSKVNLLNPHQIARKFTYKQVSSWIISVSYVLSIEGKYFEDFLGSLASLTLKVTLSVEKDVTTIGSMCQCPNVLVHCHTAVW